MRETEIETTLQSTESSDNLQEQVAKRRFRRGTIVVASSAMAATVALVAVGAWIGTKTAIVAGELSATRTLGPEIKEMLRLNRVEEASARIDELRKHTAAAREVTEGSTWKLASALPWLGSNFSATREVARSADDIASLGLDPLVTLMDSLDWKALLPSSKGNSIDSIKAASPIVTSAAHAVKVSTARLDNIDAEKLLPQLAEPLTDMRAQLKPVSEALDAAGSASRVAPGMLGADGPRRYLLLIQNNAEIRATGGIPGALAVLTVNEGRLTLSSQTTATAMGSFVPNVSVDSQQEEIYSKRIGKFMQDVNLTPDFPTAATTSLAMWERETGERLDGVVSIDPVALGYILDATGSVQLSDPQLIALAANGLPLKLDGRNVVPTLLSDVYAKIPQPELQDVYFAGVAKEIFTALSSEDPDAKQLLESIGRGAEEGRILLWSAAAHEQTVIAPYTLAGATSGPSISPAQFGVYFNDGTGAKMDYYVRRTVQLVRECSTDGYSQVRVLVTSTNSAPKDAATSLPRYVTGGGVFGIPEGSVQTNIIAYGPVQSNVETVFVAGKKTGFASNRHGGRPVGAITVRLAPGESRTVAFTFGKIVQHAEPKLSVTPTVQGLKDVVLDTLPAKCAPAG